MKKLLLASSALAFAGSAFAADLPPRMAVKAPVVAAVPFTWTGCYLGAEGGYGWGTKDFSPAEAGSFAPLGQTVRVKPQGGLAGGDIGCNYQFNGNWVVGIEGNYDWANIKDSAADPFFGGKNLFNALSSKTDALASVTGRVGYAFDRVLFYGKGGGAWARDRYDIITIPLIGQIVGGPSFVITPARDFTNTETRFGWTLGVGAEWAFADSWSAKIEYDHYDFGNRRNNLFDPTGVGPVLADIKQRIDTVKVGINYRFWSPAAAVVARY